MPFSIREELDKEYNSILIPSGKDQDINPVLQIYSGLNFDPEISLNAKETSCLLNPVNKLKVFVLGLGEDIHIIEVLSFNTGQNLI
jgi:hypothetical protein